MRHDLCKNGRNQIAPSTRRRTRLAFEVMEDRRMLASINAEYRFELQSHDVAFGYDHVSVLVTPANGTTFTDDDGDGRADQDCLFQARAGAPFGLSLGAGPTGFPPFLGNLEADFNRGSDIHPTSPVKMRFDLPSVTGVQASHARFDQLTRRLANYPDNLNYDLFPAPGAGFNSNSFVAGLLESAGTPIPLATVMARFPGTDHPGYDRPVPRASLGLSPLKRTDLVFVIDTTGSMEDDIDAAKASAARIISQLQANSLDARIAVVSYRDHPPEGDFAWQTIQKFTCDGSTADSGIQSLSVSGGGDTPEALYGALRYAMDSTDLGLWRGGTVPKKVIYITDAPPHSPEPVTGLTLSDIIRQANAGGIELGEGEGEETPTEAPIEIFPVIIGSNSQALAVGDQIAEATGGKAFRANNADDVVDALIDAVTEATDGRGEVRVLDRAVPGLLGIPADTDRPAEVWFMANESTEIGVVPIGVHGAQTVHLIDSSGGVVGEMTSGIETYQLEEGETYGLRFSAHEDLGIFYVVARDGATSVTETEKPDPSLESIAESEGFLLTDVNADGVTSAIDALTVINRVSSLNAEGERIQGELGRYDVSGDGQITAFDALLIINSIAIEADSTTYGESEFLPHSGFIDQSIRQVDDDWFLEAKLAMGLF